MKFVIVLACLLALAYANEEAAVIRSDSVVNPDSFKYDLELDNHIKASQEGALKDKDEWVVHGSYEYISKEGKPIKVTYVADEKGYQPVVIQ
ncbi:larval cuticle protein 9 [Scaptodrosophila lebanonensis]|uniref:Larval cuticle protein 9 n=1 Tax=Drosophila lebanonensis TaxID=7225 RepID=A0A6J2UIQ5_DROLE|nr:larval cuticle protein 9 [Scaptodrosophila lebanonensis]